MTNYVDYLSHKSFDPTYYHRDYKNDITERYDDSTPEAGIKRALNIALPFLSLYKPLGNTLSTAMGTVRIATHVQGIGRAENTTAIFSEAAQSILAIAAFAGTVFQYRLGTYLTTGSDIIVNLGQVAQKLSKQEYKEAAEIGFRMMNNAVYLSIMLTGSFEIILASFLLQAAQSFYQARKDWQVEKTPEAAAQWLMGIIRLYQANGQIEQIKRRDYLFSLRKFDALRARIAKGRDVEYILNHPLANLSQKIDGQQAILKDAEGNAYDFGSNFHGLGKGVVKGMNVCFKEKEHNGERITELSFKVNHVFRDRLQTVVEEVKGYSKEELVDLFQIMGAHTTGLSFEENAINYGEHGGTGRAFKISLEGLGAIFIGSNPELPTMYDRIVVHMKEGANLYQFHELLSLFALDQVLQESLLEDIQRMKIGQLFRMFSPKEATLFERTEEFFTLPIEELKATIIQKKPAMRECFLTYLPRMELQEILPGRMRFAIRGLADELRKNGAIGLTAAITGAYSDEEMFERTAKILRMGMIASEVRQANGIQKAGLSQNLDLYTGASDSVFTQLVTQRLADDQSDWDEFAYSSEIRICFSPKVLESMTYQYHSDSFGTRLMNDSWWWFSSDEYLNRPNIEHFVKEENSYFCGSNEVMAKERIHPSLITGIVVPDIAMRDALMQYFRKKQLTEIANGVETILGIDWQRFIHVGATVTEELFIRS